MTSREVDVGDLRILKEMLQTMYDVLHQDQPDCGDCDGETELIVKTPAGQTRNITKHVPLVIEHIDDIIGDLRILKEMLQTMYDVLHQDQPASGESDEPS